VTLKKTLYNLNITKKSFFNFKEERNWINIDTLKLHINYNYFDDFNDFNDLNNTYVEYSKYIITNDYISYISFKCNEFDRICIFKNTIDFVKTRKSYQLFL
jgi:hypothetical protein